jgi:hypothetical protein
MWPENSPSEVAIGPASSSAVVRAGLQVSAPGKIRISLGIPEVSGSGWMEEWFQRKERLELELAPGLHTLDAWIDLGTRKSASLRWELLTWVGQARARPNGRRAGSRSRVDGLMPAAVPKSAVRRIPLFGSSTKFTREGTR